MASKTTIILPAGVAALLFFLFSEDSRAGDSSSSSSLPPGSATDYIKKFYPLAKSAETYYQVPAVFTIAQAGLESGWGSSAIAVNANNHFGIVADQSWYGPKYGDYRAYNDVSTSYEDHGKFLVINPRYYPAFNYSDPILFGQAVANAGYATDPDYSDKLVRTIQLVQKLI